MVVLVVLLLSNFSALAQKTTVWLVNHAEKTQTDALSDMGQTRANDLMNTLKHKNIAIIYVTSEKVSLQTADPLAERNKISPRMYADSVQKLAEYIKKNLTGKNVLIVADYKTIIRLVSALGGSSPFDMLNEGDYDQLFSITLKSSGNADSFVRYYGKSHHVNAIPQSYMIDNFQQGVPGH